MAEAIARDKFHCPSCGSDAQWNPAKQALVCPYCGTESPGDLSAETGVITEHDLVLALRSLPVEKRGWKTEKVSVKCQSCQAISVFEPSRVGQRCEFCGSAQLIPYEQVKAPISPESVLPFKLSESSVREQIRGWYRSRWFAPNRLKSGAMTDTVKGLYIPYWTFDAQALARWQAESGYHYYTTESYRDANGNMQTRQVQHTRWQPSAGTVTHFFDDELVPGSRGVDAELLRKVEPFPTKELTPYSAGYVAGWIVEQYQIDLITAAQSSRSRMDNALQQMCAAEVPGDTYRNLRVHPQYTEQTFKHILLPLWMLSYTYRAKAYQVIVNGSTGSIAGKHPLSAIKIILLICFILAAGFVISIILKR